MNGNSREFDTLIIGAGISGLACAAELAKHGRSVALLEARSRVGGRILTVHDERARVPIELGAEFVHGSIAEIFEIAHEHSLRLPEVEGDEWCSNDGKLTTCDFFEEVNDVMEKLLKRRERDLSFEEFLRSVSDVSDDTREWARRYVAGFHGAKPQLASVEAIGNDAKAEQESDGDRAFRFEQGYDALVGVLADACKAHSVQVFLNSVVRRVEWSEEVKLVTRDDREFKAKRAVITLPISVLRSDTVEFYPPLDEKRAALDSLQMGTVSRIVLLFAKRFWEEIRGDDHRNLRKLSFLFSKETYFSTWWVGLGESPMLVGWDSSSNLSDADHLPSDCELWTELALASLARNLRFPVEMLREKLVAAFAHNWEADEFSRGAYTYAAVGGADAYRKLARPLGDKLFFAGEATEYTGHHATVHGALFSGRRAAREILSR